MRAAAVLLAALAAPAFAAPPPALRLDGPASLEGEYAGTRAELRALFPDIASSPEDAGQRISVKVGVGGGMLQILAEIPGELVLGRTVRIQGNWDAAASAFTLETEKLRGGQIPRGGLPRGYGWLTDTVAMYLTRGRDLVVEHKVTGTYLEYFVVPLSLGSDDCELFPRAPAGPAPGPPTSRREASTKRANSPVRKANA